MSEPVYIYSTVARYLKRQGVSLLLIFLLPGFFNKGLAQTRDTTALKSVINDTVGTETKDSSGNEDTDTVAYESPVLRAVPDSLVKAWKKSKDFAYANDPSYWVKPPVARQQDPMVRFITWLGSPGVRLFFYLLLAGILAFVLYLIIRQNKLYLFYASPKKQPVVVADEPGIHEVDFDGKIKVAEAALDYRFAIRYRYLKSLRVLDHKGLIRFNAQGTNQEYINQLSGKPIASDFRFLTYWYERVWYGSFMPTPEQFASLQKQFDHLYNSPGK